MDFSFSEEQDMLRDLAREILAGEVSHERLKAVEGSGERFDSALWSQLSDANLLGLTIGEAHGGMGFGLFELCLLLVEAGRTVAPVPVLAAGVAALTLEHFGSEAQRERWLGSMARGEALITPAMTDPGADDPGLGEFAQCSHGVTRATRVEAGWVLSGVKRFVTAARRADRLLVPARIEGEGVGLFLVDPNVDGVRLEDQRLTNRETVCDVHLSSVPLAADDVLPVLGGAGEAAASWLRDVHLVAICALQLGVSERALELTAEYASERVQFKHPIGTFQAVQHRCADGFVDLQAMRWSLWRAAWSIGEGLDAEREALIAKFWAAEGGSRIASTAQHIHAGHGVDLDYVIHRYFMWTKTLELALGSAMPQLARLGRDMARTGPQESL
jgi:alkylation response protein AidB-like acyl-CoA dehydrogenase